MNRWPALDLTQIVKHAIDVANGILSKGGVSDVYVTKVTIYREYNVDAYGVNVYFTMFGKKYVRHFLRDHPAGFLYVLPQVMKDVAESMPEYHIGVAMKVLDQ